MLQDMSINAEQVKALRESRGWSQEHLAEVAGFAILISATSVMLIGIVITLPYWWIPAGVLATAGSLLTLWPIMLNKLLLRSGKQISS